ncbi:MAG: cation:proton antiporter [Lachnospiraceae bacterium]|nr:cation:proton antiporter [Lachnospiraceae bacterium]
MESYAILRDLAVIILSAKFMAILAKKCKAPGVVGEILAGLIIGPLLLNIVQPGDFISKMAEIGVILIMFSAGLETNLKELKKSGPIALLIACAGVAVPLGGGLLLYLCMHGFPAPGTDGFFRGLFIGCIMTATSVGITVEALRELGFLKGRVGQTILSAAIIDDVIGIIVLTFVLGLRDPASNTLLVVGKTLLFLVISLAGGIVIYKLMKLVDARYPHTRRIPIIGLGLCFIMSYAAEKYFGIADITGAYVAGIILCNIRDAGYIDRKVSINSYMIFAPIFFVGIGLKTDLSGVDSSMLLFSVGFVLVALVSKVIGCGLMAKICRFHNLDCIKIGVGMMTRGEVALIITNKGLNMGVLDSSYFTAVILLIIVSSVSVPILLKLLYAKHPDPEVE